MTKNKKDMIKIIKNASDAVINEDIKLLKELAKH